MEEAGLSHSAFPTDRFKEHNSASDEFPSKSPRIASLKAADGITRNVIEEETDEYQDDDDDEGKGDTEDNEEPKSKKRRLSFTYPKQQEIIVGHHTSDSRLLVVAKWRKNNALHMRVPFQLMDTEELVKLWRHELNKNGQVNVDNVKLFAAVFAKDEANFKEPTDRDEKKQLILNLLEKKVAKAVNGGFSKIDGEVDADESHTDAVQDDPELHIGYYTQDSSVPVYASIQYKPNVGQKALCFRLEDNSHEHRTQVGWEYIKLKRRFDKGSEVETRAYIKGLLLSSMSSAIGDPKKSHAESATPASECSLDGSGILSPDTASSNDAAFIKGLNELAETFRKQNADRREKAEARYLRQSARIAELEWHVQDLKATAAAKDDEIVRLQDDVKKKNQMIDQLRAQTRVQEQKVTLPQRSSEMAALQRSLVSSQDENIRLKNRIQTLEVFQEKNVKTTHQVNTSPKSAIITSDKVSATGLTPLPKTKDLQYGQSIYRLIPPGRENAGIYQERFSRKIPYGGKVYEERMFLHEITLHVNGTDMAENVTMNGVDYARYREDGKEKFLSIVTPRFAVEHEGKIYVKRILRVEIDEDDEEQLDYVL